MVAGASGRMGALTCATVMAAADMRLVAEADPAFGAGQLHGGRFASVDAALQETRPQVAVDFTVPGAVFETVSATLRAGVHTVVGTTGLTDEQARDLSAIAAQHGAALVLVPNFSLGAVLMMRVAAEASRHFPRAEIVEMHDEGKIDAPSGTSLRSARLMTESGARQRAAAADGLPSRGLAEGGVRIHSLRLPGVLAHQEVVFGGASETLTIRHDSLSRESFMPGVLLAIRKAPHGTGTVVGLEHLLA